MAFLALLWEASNMKGSIRVMLGLLIVFGVTGGIDNATEEQLLALIPLAFVGFALMLTGVNAMNEK
jgi:hypothetical protein